MDQQLYWPQKSQLFHSVPVHAAARFTDFLLRVSFRVHCIFYEQRGSAGEFKSNIYPLFVGIQRRNILAPHFTHPRNHPPIYWTSSIAYFRPNKELLQGIDDFGTFFTLCGRLWRQLVSNNKLGHPKRHLNLFAPKIVKFCDRGWPLYAEFIKYGLRKSRT